MEQIIKIVDKCTDKLNKFQLNYHTKDTKNSKDSILYDKFSFNRETYYHIFLTSEGVRNGTYLELCYKNLLSNNDNDNVTFLEDIFKELREINNIDFYIGKLYDNSKYKDTVYVYYKPRKTKLFKIIKFIEDFDRKLCNQENIKFENKLHSNIAKLLSYPIVNYNKTDDFISIDFRLYNDSFVITSYYITKNQLQKAYDNMILINKALKKINKYEWCELVILNESY
jgi:hypothetical protein